MQTIKPANKTNKRLVPVWLRTVLVVAVIYKTAVFVGDTFAFRHYKSYLPQAIEVDRNLFVGSRIGGFLEGCGVAVFQLSEASLKGIVQSPLEFLNSHTRPNNGKQPYAEWIETSARPAQFSMFNRVANSEEATGPNCVDVPTDLKRVILSATAAPGSYYSGINKNNELLIIPGLGLAVFSHDR